MPKPHRSYTAAPPPVVVVSPHSPSVWGWAGQSLPLTREQQSRLSYNRGRHTAHMGRWSTPAGWLGRLCHWALQSTHHIRPPCRDWGAEQIYVTHRKEPQGGCQNEEAKKHAPDERIEQNSRKKPKLNGLTPRAGVTFLPTPPTAAPSP